jgi:hypothetical protein
MTPPPPVHTFILTCNRGGRWYRLKAVCSASGMETRVQLNFEPDEDFEEFVDDWRVQCMEDYEHETGLDVTIEEDEW